MTFRNWVTISAILPFTECNRYAGVRERLGCYKGRERLPLRQALDIQWPALTRLLQHGYDTTEFYRDRTFIAIHAGLGGELILEWVTGNRRLAARVPAPLSSREDTGKKVSMPADSSAVRQIGGR